MSSRIRLMAIEDKCKHLEFGIYSNTDSKVTKSAGEWYNSIKDIETSYSDGSYHIPSDAEWHMLNNWHKTELQEFLASCDINPDSSFACSSWNTIRDLPYYRVYSSNGNMEDHTGNKENCYCLLMKWSINT